MERERAFNFKLFVPPRISPGQVSAVKPQEITEDSCAFMQPLQTQSKPFEKESNMPFPAASMVAPSKSTRQDTTKKIAVMPMEKEETTLRSSQLYSKLFEEAEKIKCWKVKMDMEIGQKDRRLQDNKRTIENQRKAIQELQFGNESLSMKLEDEMSKNTDLKNKMALETTLAQKTEEYTAALVEKGKSLEQLKKIRDEQAEKLQGILATAEELQITLTHEVQRVKGLEEVLGSVTEELKLKTSELEKLQLEETKALQLTKELESKNSEIQQLMHRTDILSVEKKYVEEALDALQKEQEDLKEITQMKESKMREVEDQLSVALVNGRKSTDEIQRLKRDTEQNKKEYEELRATFTELQLQKEALSQQAEGGAADIKMLEAHLKESEENEKKIIQEMERAEEEKQQLRYELESLKATMDEQGRETKTMHKRQEDSNKSLQNELTKKEKQMKALEVKVNTLKTKIETKTKVHEECMKENKNLKRQIVTENDKYSQLETEVNEVKQELKAAHALHGEELKTLREAIEIQGSAETELQGKVQELQLTSAEAVKSKEETEVKCQHKISDMVALMDKHKNQYDKMFEEKDAELDEKRKKEVEMNAEKTSLELEMSELKIHSSDMKKQLENEIKEKEEMKHEVASLNKKIKSLKEDIKHKTQYPLTPAANSKGIKATASPKASSVKSRRAIFDFTNEQEKESESQSIDKKVMVTPQLKVSETGTLKTSWSSGNKVAVTPRIKSFRIRTPPSPGKSLLLGRSTLELDPKSDSSETNDSLSFSVQSGPFKRNLYKGDSGPLRQYGNLQKKIQSPAEFRSPGTALKLAAVKRMRDAGWTAVTNSDKRKKKVSEKIFA
ncbi:hypothetical protein SKAU_G00168870 [Synaphobranchus kaupii]|uniref:Synaptonemal complex protein 1 n=1 Tax=Synaphobranchus kaupii TaxID=118154 RepID=A0A9Q1J0M3_SYNKA|nr:hypothetical protein SKAU_G00168870 [Synaphobranchus kaupii]